MQIVLVGIGGYGNTYLTKLLDVGDQLNAKIVGVVDPYPEKSEHYKRIINQHIPVFSSLESFYDKHEADLAILSTPIHLHTSQTCLALSNGSHVLCEKPMCASLQEVEEVMKTRDATGKFVAIGFNWSYSPSVQELKQDILNGVFGKPLRFKTIVNWPRDQAYYTRNQWAGRLVNDKGQPIFDSVANNATSHYLHHMVYLLGSEMDQSALLKEVTAELYRANPIESFDTCAVKIKTEGDTDIYFYATHAVKDSFGPQFIYEFEYATIYRTEGENDNQVIARFHDGSEIIYPDPELDHLQKLATCIDAVKNGSKVIPCGPEAAFAHVQAIKAMHNSVSEIITIPDNYIHLEADTNITWVEGLSEALIQSFDQWTLLNNLGISWTKTGKTIELTQ